MLQKTRAIILLKKNYQENNLILTAYTECCGKTTFILYGASSKKSGKRLAYLQPFSLVEIIAEFSPNKDLQTIKSISCIQQVNGILTNPYKYSIVLFLSEMLYKVTTSNIEDAYLFNYIYDSVLYLDLCDNNNIANFHISFLVNLSHFLGITPNMDKDSNGMTNFDLKESEYTRMRGDKSILDIRETNILRQILRMNYRNMSHFKLSRQDRAELLDRIVSYYQLHYQTCNNLNTLGVLHATFDIA